MCDSAKHKESKGDKKCLTITVSLIIYRSSVQKKRYSKGIIKVFLISVIALPFAGTQREVAKSRRSETHQVRGEGGRRRPSLSARVRVLRGSRELICQHTHGLDSKFRISYQSESKISFGGAKQIHPIYMGVIDAIIVRVGLV